MSSRLLGKVKNAGVVGAGGGGFPTWAKLKTGAEIIIVNGAECEPLLKVDQQLLARYSAEIVSAVNQIMSAIGARKAFIALKQKYKPAITALQATIKEYPDVGVHILNDVYPAGDEHLLVNSVTGRTISPGQLPLSVGVIVLNVETVFNIARAQQDLPVTDKFVTVTGAVKNPRTLYVPLGVTAAELIEFAGGATVKKYAVISGGPCMGRIIDVNEPVTKTTKGLVVLPFEHQIVRQQRQDIAKSLRKAMAVCCQCEQCTDLCPRHLLGHPLRPHRIMRAAAYGLAASTVISQALLCSECGVCEFYTCPAGLSPRMINRTIKKELQQRGAKITFSEQGEGLQEYRRWRQVPTRRLLMRLGLEIYDADAPLSLEEIKVNAVHIPLKQHVGIPAKPLVSIGDKVEAGQLVAAVPKNALGANLHASISGTITSIDSQIIISRYPGDVK